MSNDKLDNLKNTAGELKAKGEQAIESLKSNLSDTTSENKQAVSEKVDGIKAKLEDTQHAV